MGGMYPFKLWSLAKSETTSVWTIHRHWFFISSPAWGILLQGIWKGWQTVTHRWETVVFFLSGYGIAWVGSLLINLLRAPALLDRQRLSEIESERKRADQLEKRYNEHKPRVLLEFRALHPWIEESLAVVNVRGDDACRISVESDYLPKVNAIERLEKGRWEHCVVSGSNNRISRGGMLNVNNLLDLVFDDKWKDNESIPHLPVRVKWRDSNWTSYEAEWDITQDPATKLTTANLRPPD